MNYMSANNSFITHADGIEYVNQCPCEVSRAFFEEFSSTFARVAQGTIFYLGYGERAGGTFSTESFFAKYEIPNLRIPEVTSAVVMVVHRNGTGTSPLTSSVFLHALYNNKTACIASSVREGTDIFKLSPRILEAEARMMKYFIHYYTVCQE